MVIVFNATLIYRFVYWVDSGYGRVDRAAMDGSHQTPIILDLYYPDALTIDYNGEIAVIIYLFLCIGCPVYSIWWDRVSQWQCVRLGTERLRVRIRLPCYRSCALGKGTLHLTSLR